eukprot:3791920-Rhodomonas_salina.1
MQKLLDTVFAEPRTLEDIGLKLTLVEQVNQTLLNLWCRAPTLPAPSSNADLETGESEKGESEMGESETGESAPKLQTGPFQDHFRNEIWR